VIGAAAYMFHWLKDATRFVKRHHRLLAERPVWLFSSGPLGTDLVDEDGRGDPGRGLPRLDLAVDGGAGGACRG
jgi:hypothetical protein